MSSWCRWPRSIIYLDQRKRQGCGASNKARGCNNRCNASWCACCFVHHGWYSLFIYTVGITGEFMLQAYTMQPLIRTRLLLLAVFTAATTPSSSDETLGDDGSQVRRIYHQSAIQHDTLIEPAETNIGSDLLSSTYRSQGEQFLVCS